MPEKSINDLPRALREYFEKGNAALEKHNFDYAIAMYSQVLLKEPGFFECRQALRAAQFKKQGGGRGFFKRMIGTASSSPLLAKAQLALRSNPIEALQVTEQILNSDPGNTLAHKLLAEAALNADFPRTAVLSLEIITKQAPRDRDTILKLSQALVRAGQAEKADNLLHELARAFPSDPTVAQALKDLAAQRTLHEGGYEALADGQGSYRDILKDKDEAITLEQEKREVKSDDASLRLIAEYEARLLQEPKNLRLVRSLAELCAERKDFDRALAYYQRIVDQEGNTDPSLEQAITQTTLKKLEHALQQLDESDPAQAEEAARLRAERAAFELAEAKRRVDKYPNDLQLRFDLGVLYFNHGKTGEAIAELQKAQSNPHRRTQAMNYLAQCFSRRKMYDVAARTLQNAIKEKQTLDDEKKDLIYNLGLVLEQMGKREDALEQFKLIYEIDIGYRDVAARVDAYYANQDPT